MPEYRDKRADEKMEAFNDRTKRVDFPYVLEYEEEALIYDKLLSNADVPDIHVEPHTLDMAGLFGVLTRVKEPDNDRVGLLEKAKAYNGELDEVDDVDPEKLREEAASSGEREGMSGVSPRFVGDEIAAAIMQSMDRERGFLSPLTVFNRLEDNVGQHGSIPEDKVEGYQRLLELVREEYRERAIEDVRHALAYDLDEIQSQGEKYMDHVMAYIDDDTVADELTGREQEPDETFLRAVEEQLGVPEDRKDDFRQEVSNWVSRRAREGEPFDPRTTTACAARSSASSGRTRSTTSTSRRSSRTRSSTTTATATTGWPRSSTAATRRPERVRCWSSRAPRSPRRNPRVVTDYVDRANRALRDTYDDPMSLEEYVDHVFEHPLAAAHASRYVLAAIESEGARPVVEGGEQRQRYRFFDDPHNDGEHAVLGNTATLNAFVDDLRAVAAGRGKAETILWFAGPTATGKSELKRCLVNGLREFSKTPRAGATPSSGTSRAPRSRRG